MHLFRIILYIPRNMNIVLLYSLIARFMGPTWVLSAPGGPHVGLMNFAVWVWLPCGFIIICQCPNPYKWRWVSPSNAGECIYPLNMHCQALMISIQHQVVNALELSAPTPHKWWWMCSPKSRRVPPSLKKTLAPLEELGWLKDGLCIYSGGQSGH